MNINSKKATCHRAIPTKILKQFCDSYLPIIAKIIKESITEGNSSFLKIGLYEQR